MEKSTEFDNLIAAHLEKQKGIYHIPVDMNIRKFKAIVRNAGFNKKVEGQLIRAYKKRAWAEFASMTRGRGNSPTYKIKRKTLTVQIIESDYEIEVKHG